MDNCNCAELMPLKMNLDIMLPWLEWWGVDVGATRLFFRLDVQTQNDATSTTTISLEVLSGLIFDSIWD